MRSTGQRNNDALDQISKAQNIRYPIYTIHTICVRVYLYYSTKMKWKKKYTRDSLSLSFSLYINSFRPSIRSFRLVLDAVRTRPTSGKQSLQFDMKMFTICESVSMVWAIQWSVTTISFILLVMGKITLDRLCARYQIHYRLAVGECVCVCVCFYSA